MIKIFLLFFKEIYLHTRDMNLYTKYTKLNVQPDLCVHLLQVITRRDYQPNIFPKAHHNVCPAVVMIRLIVCSSV